MARFARHMSSENDLQTSRGVRFAIEIAFRSAQAERNVKIQENMPFGNIVNVAKRTEERIIVQKRPFGTFAFASAFSHPGLGLVNILNSKKCQTG